MAASGLQKSQAVIMKITPFVSQFPRALDASRCHINFLNEYKYCSEAVKKALTYTTEVCKS